MRWLAKAFALIFVLLVVFTPGAEGQSGSADLAVRYGTEFQVCRTSDEYFQNGFRLDVVVRYRVTNLGPDSTAIPGWNDGTFWVGFDADVFSGGWDDLFQAGPLAPGASTPWRTWRGSVYLYNHGNFTDHVVYMQYAADLYLQVPDPNPANNQVTRNSRDFFVEAWTNIPWCAGYAPRIWGYIFEDTNRNGVRDNGEAVIPGSVVQIWQGSTWLTNLSGAADTGYWAYTPSTTGTYTVRGVLPAGWTWNTASEYTVNVQPGSDHGPYYFGAVPQSPTPTPTPTPTWTPTPVPPPTPVVQCRSVGTYQDTFVSATFPNTNYGSYSYMLVNGNNTALMRFYDLSLPPDATLQRATLWVNVQGCNQCGTSLPNAATTHQIVSPWSEYSTTWSNKPWWSGEYGYQYYGGPGWYGWDVTGIVRNWVERGDPQYGIAISGSGQPNWVLSAGSAYIEYCYILPTPPPTPTPTWTPTFTPTWTPTLTPTWTSTPTWTPSPTWTPTDTPTPTPTFTPTPTWTPTWPPTPTPTWTPTPTPTATPTVAVVLNRAYAFLAWYAHNGRSATQVLTGRVLAVHPAHRTVRIYVRHPSGWTPRYVVTTDGEGRFRLGAAEAGDPYFGTGERGVWMAWAEDATTGTRSNTVFWKVTWWVVHLKQ